MSGLAAIIRTDGGPADRAGIGRMVAAMVHKGPDGTTSWSDGTAALAHATLHTTAESHTAQQPLVSSDGRCAIILDGLLTNHLELRRDLVERGAILRSQSDAELVLAAYDHWGEDCVQRCDGEFAFVLWDGRAQKALCARDHQGLRPLLYAQLKDRVVIASDQRTINAGLGYRPEPNFEYLAQLSAAQFHAPQQTAARNVFRFKPAHFYWVTSNAVTHRRYWTLQTDVTIRYRNDADYIEHYREVLTRCVTRSARTDRALALEVSGGLDSSATFCLAHDLHHKGRLPAPSLRGYTLQGAPGSASDEVEYAQSAAHHVGGSLREVPLFEPPLDWFSQQAALEQDIPTYTNGAMSMGLEQAAKTDGCRAILGGTGGDQWLDGTLDYYLQHIRSLDLPRIAAAIARDKAEWGARFTFWFAAKQAIAAALPLRIANMFRARTIGEFVGDLADLDWLSNSSKLSLDQGFKRLAQKHSGQAPEHARKTLRLERADAQLAFDLMNRQYARGHVESRSPMFAREFIEFSAATPEHIRYRGGVTKWVHREAMRGICPDAILDRHTKAAFPAADLIDAAREFCAHHTSLLSADLCDQNGLRRITEADGLTSFDTRLAGNLWGTYASAAFLSSDQPKSGLQGENL